MANIIPGKLMSVSCIQVDLSSSSITVNTKIMHTVYTLLCFFVSFIRLILPIFFRVTSLVLGTSHDCPCASEITVKDKGKWTINWSPLLLHIYVSKQG